MPIVTVEIVLKTEETIRPNMARKLADEIGKIFNSPRGGTWVKLKGLPVEHYAENDALRENIHPIFVTILKASLSPPSKLRLEAELVAQAVARICDRPSENVHIIYEPEGEGRVAFGGELIE